MSITFSFYIAGSYYTTKTYYFRRHCHLRLKKINKICFLLSCEATHTLKAMASEECVDSNCCWTAVVCSLSPFWNVASTCSNIALHEISNAGTVEASKLDLNASCSAYTTNYHQNQGRYLSLCTHKRWLYDHSCQ